MIRDLFVGTWQLVAVHFYNAQNESIKMYGEAPRGMLIYDAQGHMNGQVMQRERPPLPKGREAENARDEYHAILRGYIAYFGTYEVDENAGTVTHHVHGSLIPDWVGTDQIRLFEFCDDNQRLILRTPPSTLRGDVLRGELIWERAGVAEKR
jgi:hypothetical protein